MHFYHRQQVTKYVLRSIVRLCLWSVGNHSKLYRQPLQCHGKYASCIAQRVQRWTPQSVRTAQKAEKQTKQAEPSKVGNFSAACAIWPAQAHTGLFSLFVFTLVILQHMTAKAGSCHGSQGVVILWRQRQLCLQQLQLPAYVLGSCLMELCPAEIRNKSQSQQGTMTGVDASGIHAAVLQNLPLRKPTGG